MATQDGGRAADKWMKLSLWSCDHPALTSWLVSVPREMVCSSEDQQGPTQPTQLWQKPFLPSRGSGQLAAGTCEIVTLDRDSSQPRRTIARQTARCACRKGQIAGTTRARPACVDARIIKTKQWCDMLPCLEGEGCDLLINRSGWTCTQPGGRIKTTTGLQDGLRHDGWNLRWPTESRGEN
ncbi:chemokine-like protein TAFA-5 isoform X1 [Castor canadensis]|uniref:Chemokine-like protein TAFA-5 isoform X1 n=1 Tax=Castor canadensis TaxID=51338 RepID=A0AC58NGN0_CASCN